MSDKDKEATINDYIKRRFLSWVTKTSRCWLWNGAPMKDGYGQFRINNKKQLAHRVSYMLFVGEIPSGMCVCHKCDHPFCVNPEHLFLGTHQENMTDMKNKNRHYIGDGELSKSAKLTENDIKKIRADARTQREIARDFGVAHCTIGCIKRRETWKNVY